GGLAPLRPLAARLGRLAVGLAEATGVDRIEVEYFGRIAERDTRLLTVAAVPGLLAAHTEEEGTPVKAPALAEERGIQISERTDATARDFTDLVRVSVVCGGVRARVVGT